MGNVVPFPRRMPAQPEEPNYPPMLRAIAAGVAAVVDPEFHQLHAESKDYKNRIAALEAQILDLTARLSTVEGRNDG